MKYRRLASTIGLKLRHGTRRGVKVFVALVGGLATVFGIVQAGGGTFAPSAILVALGAIATASVVVVFWTARIDHLPDSIVIDDAQDVRYELLYETKDVCREFNRQTVGYFGRDCVDDLLVESWRSKNPEAFVYLRNARAEPCAALCLFGLRKSFMEQFIRGRVTECDIEREDVLDLKESKKADALYLAVIIVNRPHTQLGHRRASVMVWATIQYLKRVYGLRRARRLLAVPVNKASENLLKRLGFQLTVRADTRKDGHDLYALDVSKGNADAALERVGDYSQVCKISL